VPIDQAQSEYDLGELQLIHKFELKLASYGDKRLQIMVFCGIAKLLIYLISK
jgi:hypothetical protein